MRGVGESCDTWRHESPLEAFVFMRPHSLPPFSDLSTPHCPWPLAPECGSPEWGEGKARRGLQREEALGGGGGEAGSAGQTLSHALPLRGLSHPLSYTW